MNVATTAATGRLQIVSVGGSDPGASFAEDVDAGLRTSPKSLPSKYFYDEIGSVLFDAITLLPEYYLTRAETEILRDWGWEIVRALGGPVEFVELGSGSAAKTRILIEEALRVQRELRYSPIDISAEALRGSAEALVASYPALTIRAYAGDYFSILGKPALQRTSRVLAMFMGSNIGNYEPPQAIALVRGIAASLKAGDGLLLGADLKKDPAILEAAYDDAAGVTAAFNKNLLGRINRELGGTFDLKAFNYVSRYDGGHSRIESSLESQSAHVVRINALDQEICFEQGERIRTEFSYKFSVEDVAALAKEAGLELTRTWSDLRRRFSVNLLRK